MELFLLTGFLGAGKTTVLKNILQAWKQKKLFVIINEFGKIGVDGDILQTVAGTLAEINNGSIFCACRLPQFEQTLRRAMLEQPDSILVEASGLSDPTAISSLLSLPEFSSIEWKGSICVVDAARFFKLVTTAQVITKQLQTSSLAIINKADLATPQEIEAIKEKIHQLQQSCTVVSTQMGILRPEWLDFAPVQNQSTQKEVSQRDITLQKALLHVSPTMTLCSLEKFLALVAEATYRIKGFVRVQEGLFLVNCVGTDTHIVPWQNPAGSEKIGELVFLAGRGMPLRKSLQNATMHFPEITE